MRRAAPYVIFPTLLLLLGWWSAAPRPFFGDLPASVKAIESGSMVIQVPGYAVFHLVARALGQMMGLSAAFVVFSLACGILSQLYMMLSASLLAGTRAVWLTGLVTTFGLQTFYFSAVGSSYIADMLAVAGTFYHGLRVILRRSPADRGLAAAAGWCGVGVILRPVSSIFVAPAVAWLAWRYGSPRGRGFAVGILALAALIVAGVTYPFYGSWAAVMAQAAPLKAAAAASFDIGAGALTTLVRIFGFPLYFYHVWLLLGLGMVYAALRARPLLAEDRRIAVFAAWIAAPYFLALLRHLPNPGYYCYLAPVITLLPFFFRDLFAKHARSATIVALLFSLLASVQVFLLRPVRPTNLATLVADAYFLQYSRAGLMTCTAESLSSLALKSGVGAERVPADRRRVVDEHERAQKTP